MATWDIDPGSSRLAVANARSDLEKLATIEPSLTSAFSGTATACKNTEISAALQSLRQDYLEPLLSNAESAGMKVCDATDDVITAYIEGDDEMRETAENSAATAGQTDGF